MDDGDDGTRVLGLVGSLRSDSVNRMLMSAACDAFDDRCLVDVYDGLKDIPPFDEDDETEVPLVVDGLRSQIDGADAILVATPEYNASVPGQLKNAIDWISRPFATNVLRGKSVAVIGASPSPGGARGAIADAQRILSRAGASVIPGTLSVPRAFTVFDATGAMDSSDLRDSIANVAFALVSAARASACQSV